MTPTVLETNIPISLIYGISIYLAAWMLSNLLLKSQKINNTITPISNRYGSIDGLRGVLAVGVLVSHSSAAYAYFCTGIWKHGGNPLIDQLAQSSVALFFMITAFLFTNKALENKINWKKFYKSRIQRLFPLYSIVVTITFFAVMVIDDFKLHVTTLKFVMDYFKWLAFVVFGRPEINNMTNSALIISGVNWTLKFEVLFYMMAVPMIYYTSKILSDFNLLLGCIFFGILLVALKIIVKFEFHFCVLHFLVGIFIALLYRNGKFNALFKNDYYKIAGLFSVVALGFTNSGSISLILLFVIFSSVLGGGSLFGLLKTKEAIWLGDISYGIYLLHGMVLYSLLSILKSNNVVDVIDLRIYLILVIFVAIIVVILASISYVFMEKPLMISGKNKIAQKGDAPELVTPAQ